MSSPRIIAARRPFVITFHETGTSYPLTAEEAQRLLDAYPSISSTRNRVVLRGEGGKSTLSPATLGGGPAFEVHR